MSQQEVKSNISSSSKDRKQNKSHGRWTKEEHTKFIEGLKMFGKNWKKVEEYIGTRSGAQIRSHAQKFFNRLEKEIAKNETQNQFEDKNIEECCFSAQGSQKETPPDELLSMKDEEIRLMGTSCQEPNDEQPRFPTPSDFNCHSNLEESYQSSTLGSNSMQQKMPFQDVSNHSCFTPQQNPVQLDNQYDSSETSFFFNILLSHINNNVIEQIKVPKYYDLCVTGSCNEQKQYQQIYTDMMQTKPNRQRLLSFKMIEEEDEKSNLKYINNRRKCSLDQESINKKMRICLNN